MTNLYYLPLILSGVALNAIAQLALKQGAMKLNNIDFSINNISSIISNIIFNPWIIIGMIMYGISIIICILTLSRVEVSYAYPMLSIGYIIVAIAGWGLFNESLSINKILGIIIICIGVVLISKS